MTGSQQYFYVWQPGVPVGFEVAPGRWGGAIQSMGIQHNKFLREAVWELVRRDAAPSAVSRLVCTFVFDDLAVVRGHSNGQSIYVVTLIDEAAESTRADMAFVDAVPVARTVDDIENLAARYWTGQATGQPKWEVLTMSALRIEQVVP